MARILIIEDEDNLRFSIRQALKRAGHDVSEADSLSSAGEAIERTEYDVVVTDLNLRGEDGLTIVRRLREDGFGGVVLVMTAYATVETAVSAMKIGADDYVQKPLSLEELHLLVERLLEARAIRTRLRLYERLETSQSQEREIIGSSPAWTQTLAMAKKLSAIPLPVPRPQGSTGGAALPTILLMGETGAGKGVLARFIHESASQGASQPFVHVNCAAIPAALVESELFGHEKGAFTDAKGHREGLFEMADGGTVFLDEIGDMPVDLQTKLLTVLESGMIRRVGGTRERFVRVRVVAATNADLVRRVDEGRFRRDLFFRLNAFTVRIPSLRERGDDAVQMAEQVLARLTRQYGRPSMTLSPEGKDAIRRHTWPGNARELINVMQSVAMLSDSRVVGPRELGLAPQGVRAVRIAPSGGPMAGPSPSPNGASAAPAPAPAAPAANPGVPAASSNGSMSGGIAGAHLVFDFDRGIHTADEVERELIVQALRRTGGNVSKAAKLIGMQRSSFRYRIERYSLEPLVQEISQR